MPEATITVRWPDGRRASYWSPSLVVHDHLDADTSYPVAEFVRRAHHALDLASERVRARYGFACTSAMHTQDTIAADATQHPHGDVHVVGIHPPLDGVDA